MVCWHAYGFVHPGLTLSKRSSVQTAAELFGQASLTAHTPHQTFSSSSHPVLFTTESLPTIMCCSIAQSLIFSIPH